ncbi:LacI family DNA-binding transcriptional regulator [Aestuariimicrobium sp. T2.26MG-19.2B]|uniref:LacI family DNA-binding transcriptional regulator n=1 Tax=Aestuariimicrobium sp. T2.26MG-19.2B TaxID=3040679 RepID=UPI0024777F38|nr:LacI family DNA-binding transcriptional regulator [Aestuariimicrobium sp. T2.26MG-19.2B]CAI9405512.1 Lactose operon repressor [Aestuariimicrobium sp. T2.26MG-19.2B]
MRNGRAVSMAQVAQRAGVSHQTVSRVLNAPELVREPTRLRVQEAIRELGFRPNLAARALVRGTTTSLIGAVSPGNALFGPNHLLAAIDRAAHAHSFATVIGTLPEADLEAAHATSERFRVMGVQGVVFIAVGPPTAALASTLADDLPVCVIAPHFDDPRVSVIGVDHAAGARMAVEELVAEGRRRVTHVAGPQGWFDADVRAAAWQEETARLGVRGDLLPGGWSAGDGYAAAAAVLAAHPRPDAVFCANDQVALGLMRGLAHAGVSVPDDIAVVGFDDVDGADHFSPSLTTIRQPFAEVGERSIEVLWAMIGGAPPVRELLAPTLVVRSSSRARQAALSGPRLQP